MVLLIGFRYTSQNSYYWQVIEKKEFVKLCYTLNDTYDTETGDIMLFVAMLQIVDHDLNAKVRPAHLEYINKLFQEDKVLMAGPFADKQGGMVIYKASSEAEAKALAEADPVIVEGARTLELREWNPLELPL